jgi:hypothetical protein
MEIFEGGSNLIMYFKDVIKLNNMDRKKIKVLWITLLWLVITFPCNENKGLK